MYFITQNIKPIQQLSEQKPIWKQKQESEQEWLPLF